MPSYGMEDCFNLIYPIEGWMEYPNNFNCDIIKQ